MKVMDAACHMSALPLRRQHKRGKEGKGRLSELVLIRN